MRSRRISPKWINGFQNVKIQLSVGSVKLCLLTQVVQESPLTMGSKLATADQERDLRVMMENLMEISTHYAALSKNRKIGPEFPLLRESSLIL